jgi:hypothetical protein
MMGTTGQPIQSDDVLGAIQRFINGYNQKTQGTKNDLVLLTKDKLDKKAGKKQKRCKTGSKRCGKACIKKQYKCSANKKKRAVEEEPSRPGPRR